jgi:hypothetical protein
VPRPVIFLALASALAAYVFVFVVLAGAFAGSATLTACSNTDANAAITPTTGIVVRSDLLLARLGCGEKPSQAFKYAVVVANADGIDLAAQVSDCFADATFVSLAPTDGGSYAFTLQVYVYDKALYDLEAGSIQAAVGTINAQGTNPLAQIPATWTTTCQASEETNVEAVAACGPLLATGFTVPDGGADAAADGAARDSSPDAAGDAAADAAEDSAPDTALSDAPDAAAPDAPID